MPNNPKAIDNLKPAKKGEIRNPKGKPKGTKHLSTHIKEMLEDDNFELKLKDGTILKGRPVAAVIKTAIAKAVSGDMRAFDMLGKYGYGQKIDLTSGGQKITPILGGMSVQANDSPQKDIEPEQ
jgi:hypothetical protein